MKLSTTNWETLSDTALSAGDSEVRQGKADGKAGSISGSGIFAGNFPGLASTFSTFFRSTWRAADAATDESARPLSWSGNAFAFQ